MRMAAYLVTVPFSMSGLRESPPPADPAGAALLLAVLAVLTGGATAPGSDEAGCAEEREGAWGGDGADIGLEAEVYRVLRKAVLVVPKSAA